MTEHNPGIEVDSPLIPKKIGQFLAWANIATSFFQIGSSRLDSLGNTADGIHNLSDGVVYHIQTDLLHKHTLKETSVQRRRKLTYWMIALSSSTIGGKSIYDAIVGEEHDPNKWSEYSSLGSLALAGAVAGYISSRVLDRMKRGVGLTVNEIDFVKHSATDLGSAAGAVSSIYLQKNGLHMPADLVATATAGISAWTFRPSKKNLSNLHQH